LAHRLVNGADPRTTRRRHAVMVAQVDEDQPAVVAAVVGPPPKANRRTDVGGAQPAAGGRAIGVHGASLSRKELSSKCHWYLTPRAPTRFGGTASIWSARLLPGLCRQLGRSLALQTDALPIRHTGAGARLVSCKRYRGLGPL